MHCTLQLFFAFVLHRHVKTTELAPASLLDKTLVRAQHVLICYAWLHWRFNLFAINKSLLLQCICCNICVYMKWLKLGCSANPYTYDSSPVEHQDMTHHHRDCMDMHILWQPVLCCAVLCCAVLCCAVLCCAVLCCAVLCCAVNIQSNSAAG